VVITAPTRTPDALGPKGRCAAGQPFGLGRAKHSQIETRVFRPQRRCASGADW